MKKIKHWIKKHEKQIYKIKYHGLWVYPVSIILIVLAIGTNAYALVPVWVQILILELVASILQMFIWIRNHDLVRRGLPEERITWLGALFRPLDQYEFQDNRDDYICPKIDPRLLSAQPQNVIFGKQDNLYVCKPPSSEGSVLVVGPSGSGKSSAVVIPSILASKINDQHLFITDIKGELSAITALRRDVIIDPENRYSFGIDPFFSLTSRSSVQDVSDCMNGIAVSLIPKRAEGSSESVWNNSARILLFSALFYCWYDKNLRCLTDMLQWLLGSDIHAVIQEINDNSSDSSPAKLGISSFPGMSDATLFSVFMNLQQKVFPLIQDTNLRWMFGPDSKKYSPTMLWDRDVYLCIPADKLSTYSSVMLLCYNQLIQYGLSLSEARDDPDRKWIGIYIDETVALLQGAGQIAMLSQGLRLLRSKRMYIMMVVQSIQGLRSAYSQPEMDDILTNLSYKLILGCDDPTDGKLIADLAGKYKAKENGWSGNGHTRSQSVSLRDKPIVELEDLMRLEQNGEAILLSHLSGYCRFKKAYYFQDTKAKYICNRIAKNSGKVSPFSAI